MSADDLATGGPRGSSGAVEVLVIGPAYCDLLFSELEALPSLGTERFAGGFTTVAGGSAITAVALRRLGRSVALGADVGADALGRVVRDDVARAGVATAWLRVRRTARTPVTAVLSTPNDRAFVTWLPPAGDGADVRSVLRASGARHLHVAGFPAALHEPDLVATAHAMQVSVSFDPGWDRPALHDARVRAVADACDVLLPNLAEALELADLPAPDVDDADVAPRALERLVARRPSGVTIVKDGARGALAAFRGERAHAVVPPVPAVDATGAGDVFDAGFLDAWLSGRPLADAVLRGALCGARAVTRPGGATAAPTRSELDRALRDHEPPAIREDRT